MYVEVQAAESRADFIHKMKMLLKELRETRISLRIINEKPIIKDAKIEMTLKECNELIGIFTKSIETAKKNRVP
jgi:four helix bundle protein